MLEAGLALNEGDGSRGGDGRSLITAENGIVAIQNLFLQDLGLQLSLLLARGGIRMGHLLNAWHHHLVRARDHHRLHAWHHHGEARMLIPVLRHTLLRHTLLQRTLLHKLAGHLPRCDLLVPLAALHVYGKHGPQSLTNKMAAEMAMSSTISHAEAVH